MKTMFVFCFAILLSASALAVDGVVLINQAAVMAAGGFPYHITQPGSYKLSGNLVLSGTSLGVGQNGAIQIDADNVTVDLNGFAIIGPNTCTVLSQQPVTSCANNFSDAHDIHAGVFSALRGNIAILNGTVRGFVVGIFLGDNARVEAVTATRNSSDGIDVNSGIVRRCNASQNGSQGIAAVGFGTVIESNVANFNGGTGIFSGGGSVSGNIASLNGFEGLGVFSSLVSSNTLLGNKVFDLTLQDAQAFSNHNNNCSGAAC